MKIKDIYDFFLELLFPSSLVERKVREMELEDFEKLKDVSFNENLGVLSFFKYKNSLVREAIRQIKYKRSRRLSKIFALIIYEELLEELSDMVLFQGFGNPVLVPIPMSGSERSERRFNQVELFIEELVGISGGNLPFDFKIFRKIKETERQTKLKREERLKNVLGAYEASPRVRGKNIILVDDVYTTGATLNEAKKVLKQAGAKVFSITIAR